jgi:DNA-binding CsgD family transcriptional regulator
MMRKHKVSDDVYAAPSVLRAMRDLAEIAVEATSYDAFANASLALIAKALSVDACAMKRTLTGLHVSVETVGLGLEPFRQSPLDFLNELTEDELRRGLSNATVLDDDIFTPHRKSSLRLYTDYLRPQGFHRFCCWGWMNRNGAFWLTMSRAGRGVRYMTADMEGLDALGSILTIGAALHAVGTGLADGGPVISEACAHARGLTRAEFQVAELAARGLSNEAAALVLGRSKNTVRNQLAASFSKLRISNRLELGAALRAPRPPDATRRQNRAGTLALVVASESERGRRPGSPPV